MPEGTTLDPHQDETRPLELALQAWEAIANQLEASVRTREQLVQLSKQPSFVIDAALVFPEEMRRTWEELCRAGMAGKAADVHAAREGLLHRFEARLHLVDRVAAVAKMVTALTGLEMPGLERLPQAAAELVRLKESIFARWETLEDLEDMLAERFPLPNAKLEVLGRQYRPPQAWFDQEGKPF